MIHSSEIKALVEQIYTTDYYVALLERLCDPTTLHTNHDAVRILNDFWFALPDNTSIRTPTFFKLCDIIESEEDYS